MQRQTQDKPFLKEAPSPKGKDVEFLSTHEFSAYSGQTLSKHLLYTCTVLADGQDSVEPRVGHIARAVGPTELCNLGCGVSKLCDRGQGT